MRGIVSAVVLSALALGAVGVAQAQVAAVRAAYTVEPFAPTDQVTVKGTGVRFRAEPFATKETPVLSSGSTGLSLRVIGIVRMADWNWYQVVLSNGQKAFIRSDLTTAPSRGGASAVSPAPVQPQPTSPATVVSSAPVYQPSSPAWQPPTPTASPSPAYKPTPAPALPPAQSPFDNSVISLTPKSAPPAADTQPKTDPSGLLSVPPGQ